MRNDDYKTLGLKPDATEKQVKQAFRRLGLQYHPDHNPGDLQAAERFRKIKEAYDRIRSPQSASNRDDQSKLSDLVDKYNEVAEAFKYYIKLQQTMTACIRKAENRFKASHSGITNVFARYSNNHEERTFCKEWLKANVRACSADLLIRSAVLGKIGDALTQAQDGVVTLDVEKANTLLSEQDRYICNRMSEALGCIEVLSGEKQKRPDSLQP